MLRKGWLTNLFTNDKRFVIRKFFKDSYLSAATVTAEFNEKFSTSISLEIVRRVLRVAGLNVRFSHGKFFARVKNRKLRKINDK